MSFIFRRPLLRPLKSYALNLRGISDLNVCCPSLLLKRNVGLLYPVESCLLPHVRAVSFFAFSGKEPWKKAVSQAERIVGYPTSFMSLRCLLSDELASVALHLRKLVGTKHPLLQTAKNFLNDGSHSIQMRGLVVLLVAKAAGPSSSVMDPKVPSVSGIHPSQRTLAEITEMIYTAFLVHRGVFDLSNILPSDGPLKDIEFGNKMAVLSGDFLLASSSSALANLRNTLVVDLISQSIDHMTQAAFDAMNYEKLNHEPSVKSFDEWKDYVFHSAGSLIGHSCKSALLLTNQRQEFVDSAFEFGKNLAWAQQLHQDLIQIRKEPVDGYNYLMSSPVILQNEVSPVKGLSHSEILQALKGGSAIEKAQDLCHHYVSTAKEAIKEFPNQEAKGALNNLLHALTTFK